MKRVYPEAPIAAVSGVVFDSQGKVLLAQRGRAPAKGKWSLPGGVVHVGEELEEALKREIREETGVDVHMERLLCVSSRILKDRDGRVRYHYILLDYLCVMTGGDARAGSDVEQVRWVDIDGVSCFDLTEGVKDIILEGMHILRQNRSHR